MLKTNSKIVKERVKKYILQQFEPCEENAKKDFSTFEKVASHIVKTWKNETPEETLKSWLQGLPSEIYVTPWTREERALLKEWLEETEEEAEKYDSDKVEELFYLLITREIKNATNN